MSVPFLTETFKHPPVDCGVCSCIMGVLAWTNGDVTKRIPEWPDYRPLIARLRHHMGAGTYEGTTLGMNLYALSVEFDYLPAFNQDIFTPWSDLDAITAAGTHVAAVCGNPSRVHDANSPLRTVQHSDDYDHTVLITGRTGTKKRLLDPLRREPMSWTGLDVPDADVVQFASRFTNSNGVECALFRVGAAADKPKPPPPPPPEDPMKAIVIDQANDIVLPAGTRLYRDLGTTRFPRDISTSEPRPFGAIEGVTGYRAVEVHTTGQLLWLYVKGDVGSVVPKVTVPPVDCTEALKALLAPVVAPAQATVAAIQDAIAKAGG